MSWQTLFISKASKLSIKNSNILLKQVEESDVVIPIDEISVIIIENLQVTISAIFMQCCAEKNIVVIFVNDKFLPAGIYLPLYQHSRTTKNTLLQISWSQPFKNRLWQKVIKTKISNQHEVIQHIRNTDIPKFKNIIANVQSGDKTNRESYAATLYWTYLFKNFKRNDDADIRNSLLNYGYSIVRSAIARSVCSGGLIPAIGIFHKSELNAFNLVDDLLEPFRPIVDLHVYGIIKKTEIKKLERKIKIALVDILNKKIEIDNKQTTVLNAIQQCVFSLLKASERKNANYLLLPYCA